MRNDLIGIEYHTKMCENLGNNTISYDTVWFQTFKSRNFDIGCESHSGRLIEVNCEQLKQITDQDKNVLT